MAVAITISDTLDVYLLSLLASVPAIYIGLFFLKLIKARGESTKALAASISVGILLASFYDLTKGTAGIGTGVLKSVTDVFNVITFSAVFLGFIALYTYTKTKIVKNNNDCTIDLLILTYAWTIFGIGLHSTGEGIIIGYDFATGVTSLSLAQISSFVLHKIAEGFTIGVLIIYGALKNRHALATGVIAGIPTVIGTAMGYALLPPTLHTYFFAASLGATIFIIIRLIHLITSSRYNGILIGILAGFLFMYFAGVLHQFE